MPLTYEASSPYFGREGYYGSLTSDQQEALEIVQRFVVDESIDLSDLALNALAPQLTLLRYLRANKFDVEKTTGQIRKNVDWRIEHDVKGLVDKTPEEILGCDMDDLVSVYPHWQCGFDESGQPVMYKLYSKKFQVERLLQMTTLEAIKMYHVWEQEACCRLCYEQSLATGYIVETVSAVVDIDGLAMNQLTRDFLTLLKNIATIDQEQYPETLGKTYILNTPIAFPFVWRIIKPWLDPVTVSKINIFGTSGYDETLKNDIGTHSLPLTYNGTRPALSPDVHPYAAVVFANGPGDTLMQQSGDQVTILDRMKRQQEERLDVESVQSRESNGFLPSGEENSGAVIQLSPTLSSSSISSSKFADALDVYRGYSMGPGGLHQSWEEELSFYNNVLEGPSRRGRRAREAGSCDDWMIPSVLLKKPVKFVRRMNLYVVAFCLLVSLACVGVSSYALSAMYWTSGEVVQLQMWSGVVILCFSCFLAIMNFMGFVGTYTSNSPLLRLYTVCLMFLIIVFIVVGIMSLVVGYGHNYVSSDKINRISSDQGDAKKTLKEYNQIVGWVGTVLAVMTIGPFVISSTLIKMFNDAMHEAQESTVVRELMIGQYRSVLLIAQIVSFLVAIAMIGYAGATLDFLFKINFQYPLFAVYALLYSGVTVILGGVFGIWAAYSSFFTIQRIYHCVVMPAVSFAVVGTAVASVIQMTHVSKEMNKSYEDLDVNHDKFSKDDLETIIQIELLVGAVLGISTFLYQLVCAFSSLKLYQLLVERSTESDRDLEGGYYSHPAESRTSLRRGRLMLSFGDKVTVAFSLLTSFLHIYVSGTFVLFATNTNNSSWMLAIWKTMGKYDSRYTSSDAFLVSSSGFMAFVVGPLLLVYVWTIVNNHPVRQVCGIITYSLEIYTYILYFAIAIHTRNTISLQNPITFILLFLCLNLVRCAFPVWIVMREVRSVIAKTSGTHYRALDSEHVAADEEQGGMQDALAGGSSRSGAIGSGARGGAVELAVSGRPPPAFLADSIATALSGHGKRESFVQCDDNTMLDTIAAPNSDSSGGNGSSLRSRGHRLHDDEL
mmetsp:Transcript_14441/g.23917  ORF Transcript_14441/g.23917 Transcript_14441/m.23917 type:complete len:1061 (+) Transcript_14441:165-3347(+)